MQHLAAGVTVPDDAVLLSRHPRTLYDQTNRLRGAHGEMGCEGIDNHDFSLFHLGDLRLASGVVMLYINRTLELIENFVVGVNMEIVTSIRPFDNHEDEVRMPKDFLIAY